MTIYLDNAATTRVCNEAAAASLIVMTEHYGNPSSSHRMGRQANAMLEEAREYVTEALDGLDTGQLFFTSGGTESNNWAIFSGAALMKRDGRHIISSKAEHESVLKPLAHLSDQGFEVTLLDPEPDGSVSVEKVLQALREDTILVSLMLVNNETGAITDIQGVSDALKKARPAALLHTDAVQAFLKIPVSAKALGADMISVSAHKIHGPKGCGALYVRRDIKLPPMLTGGGQESERRSGTEGMSQIAAFGAAAKIGLIKLEETWQHLTGLRRFVIERLINDNINMVINADGVPHIISISLPGHSSEVLMNYLEAKEIFVSKSSACGKGGRSHVLSAMKLRSDLIDATIRLSMSRDTTTREMERFCSEIIAAEQSLIKKYR